MSLTIQFRSETNKSCIHLWHLNCVRSDCWWVCVCTTEATIQRTQVDIHTTTAPQNWLPNIVLFCMKNFPSSKDLSYDHSYHSYLLCVDREVHAAPLATCSYGNKTLLWGTAATETGTCRQVSLFCRVGLTGGGGVSVTTPIAALLIHVTGKQIQHWTLNC